LTDEPSCRYDWFVWRFLYVVLARSGDKLLGFARKNRFSEAIGVVVYVHFSIEVCIYFVDVLVIVWVEELSSHGICSWTRHDLLLFVFNFCVRVIEVYWHDLLRDWRFE